MATNRTLTSSVYEHLRRDLISGAVPPDQRLHMGELSERYGVGTSPIREALNRLSSEGFVEQIDRRGFRSQSLHLDELEELTKTRCWIAEIAVRQSVAHGDDAWEERAILAFHRLDKAFDPQANYAIERREALHKEFHRTLLSACGSQPLLQFWDTLFDRARRYQLLSLNAARMPRDLSKEHKDLLDALIERDEERAVRLHIEHVERTRDIVKSNIAKIG